MALTAETSDIAEEKKLRKRVQNRINQRARRERLQKTHPETAGENQTRAKRRPYRVERWRVEELEFMSTSTSGSGSGSESQSGSTVDALTQVTVDIEGCLCLPEIPVPDLTSITDIAHSTPSPTGSSSTPPLAPDHILLNLVHYNVSRGLRRNKEALWRFTSHYVLGYNSAPRTIHPDVLFYGSSLISAFLDSLLPGTLAPTKMQMSCIHATWINLLPFPRMRENLINHETQFNHSEFIDDMIGCSAGVDPERFFSQPSMKTGCNDNTKDQMVLLPGDDIDDEVTLNRNGLILWDEPHRVESWEATPGFLRKWMWTLEGCEELIESSNRWRRVRGEEPIRVIMHGMAAGGQQEGF
ncbi:hypothetical protein BDV12DRAFT_171364, partial [Aspergillus spectabilis]